MQATTPADTAVLATIFKHNTWANLTLLEFCEGLSAEQLSTEAVGGFGAIRETLWHIIGAEQSYVERTNGKRPPRPLVRGSEQAPSFEQLKEVARWFGDEMLQLAVAATRSTRVEERSDDGTERVTYPLASLVAQSITHSTEHRTQICTIITQLGMEPPDLSGWRYMEVLNEFVESRVEG